MFKNKKAFTLVELIVVITIIAILWTIAFISLQWYSKSSRNSVRISDVSNMKISLELFHLNSWKYPLPDDNEIVDYGWETLWYQWQFWINVVSALSRNMSEIPTDPLTNKKYIFSVINNKNEYQILSLLEWELSLNTINQTNAANIEVNPKVDWIYNGVFVKTASYIVPSPSIITSITIPEWLWLTLDNTNITSQIINWWENIPNIWNVNYNTWALTWLWLYATWTITKDSTTEEKLSVYQSIVDAYSGTVLATDWWTIEILLNKETEEEQLLIVETVVLKNTTSVATIPVSTSKTVADCETTVWEVIYWTTDWLIDGEDILTCDDDIITCNWTTWSWITIKACNQWATTVYTDQTFASEATARDSWVNQWAWWLYQWWNNAENSYNTATSTLIVSTTDEDSIYNSSPFVLWSSSYRYDWIETQNDNLWWNITDTSVSRKWPCETWYHVPSKSEWQNLFNLKWDANDANLCLEMMDDLKMPMAWVRSWNDGSMTQQGSWGRYWSSSPGVSGVYYIDFWWSYSYMINSSNEINRAQGLPVRCFKN